MINLEHISRIYQRKDSKEVIKALDDVSLALPDKGFVAILGASGSGKTTLLNIIGGLDRPDEGNMVVDDLSTKDFSGGDWDSYRNNKIGFVLQNCYLLPHLSIYDNVRIKLQIASYDKDKANKLTEKALESVGLLDRKNDRPKNLSGGQKQRIAIARAIVNKPTVVLADEPTGALDSKTGKQIMTLLKELSKTHLVVIVTHNEEYAKEYADRIVKLKDGKIISDSDKLIIENKVSNKKLKKVKIPFLTSLKWGFKNLFTRKYSTASIIIASSLGLASIGLILSISSSVRREFAKVEESSIEKYPLRINSNSPYENAGNPEYTQYPSDPIVHADLSYYMVSDHYPTLSNRFRNYMNEMPKEYYYVAYDNGVMNFKLFTEYNTEAHTYAQISTTGSFYKGIDKEDYLNLEYECLIGSFPKEAHEIALVVDTYNSVSASTLVSLGFNIDTSHYQKIDFSFADVMAKKYRYVPNNNFFYQDTDGLYKILPKTAKQFYEDSTFELEIVGIIRQRQESNLSVLSTGLMYTPAFAQVVENDNFTSDIVTAQIADEEKSVRTGAAFYDESGSYALTKHGQYERAIYECGGSERITGFTYYTKTVASRENIRNYINAYVPDENVDFLRFYISDTMKDYAEEFYSLISLMSGVLYTFAAVSVVVAAILNSILTWISIHQRTSEIGLLRSMGARKQDIALMVETESMMTGILATVVSVILALILVVPVSEWLTATIKKYNFTILAKNSFVLGGFHWWVVLVMLGIGVVSSVVSALIPSIIAARKDPAKAMNE